MGSKRDTAKKKGANTKKEEPITMGPFRYHPRNFDEAYKATRQNIYPPHLEDFRNLYNQHEHMTIKKRNIMPYLNLIKNRTYKLLLSGTYIWEKWGKKFENIRTEKKTSRMGRRVEKIYFIKAVFHGYTTDTRTGKFKLNVFVLSTNIPKVTTGPRIIDIEDFRGVPIDITVPEEVESNDGKLYQTVMSAVRRSRQVEFTPHLDSLGHTVLPDKKRIVYHPIHESDLESDDEL